MDVVVTVPKARWSAWIAEGDLPGAAWSGLWSHFTLGGRRPRIVPGERVYVVAHGRLRGYAPLIEAIPLEGGGVDLVRTCGAVAVTLPTPCPGFQGWRYRWWDRAQEIPFPEWPVP